VNAHVHVIRQTVKVPRCNAADTLSTLYTCVQRHHALRKVCQVVTDPFDRLYVHRPPEGAMRSEWTECGIVPRQLGYDSRRRRQHIRSTWRVPIVRRIPNKA
jgi:hypothetical protein